MSLPDTLSLSEKRNLVLENFSDLAHRGNMRKWISEWSGVSSDPSKHPKYHNVRNYFLSLPPEMNLIEKRKQCYAKFSDVLQGTICRWINKWQPNDSAFKKHERQKNRESGGLRCKPNPNPPRTMGLGDSRNRICDHFVFAIMHANYIRRVDMRYAIYVVMLLAFALVGCGEDETVGFSKDEISDYAKEQTSEIVSDFYTGLSDIQSASVSNFDYVFESEIILNVSCVVSYTIIELPQGIRLFQKAYTLTFQVEAESDAIEDAVRYVSVSPDLEFTRVDLQ